MLYLLPNNLSCVAKASLLEVPVLGWILRYGKTVPIVRENLSEAKQALAVAEKFLRAGRHIAVAPEGGRRRGKSISDLGSCILGEFKKGPFHIATHTGVRIVPIIVSGSKRIGNNGLANKPGTVYVDFLDPISSEFVKSGISHDELRVHTHGIFRKNLRVRTDEEVLGRVGNNLPWIVGFILAHVAFGWWILFK